MLFVNIITNLCELFPLIFKAMGSAFDVFFSKRLVDFGVVLKVTFNVGDLFVADILLLEVVEDVVLVLVVHVKK